MIKLENTEVVGWEAAIRGMRNPMNSWEKSDSGPCGGSGHIGCLNCYDHNDCDKRYDYKYHIGTNDHDLMMRLAKGGSVHAKYRRMIAVYVDITAPLYWWKEFDTYKVGTVANSCSTMHKIHEKEFTLEDFSCEYLKNYDGFQENGKNVAYFLKDFEYTVKALNTARKLYLQTGDKQYWWQMIQLLPSSYNQRRTVMLNYEVLAGIYPMRKDHKLDEWRDFCQWIEQLPYSEIITARTEGKIEITGWRPISEYDCKKYDWVLVKCFDGYRECIPTVAEMRYDRFWYGEDGLLPFEPRYFFDMQQLDNRESED